jgi:hypothetical protein
MLKKNPALYKFAFKFTIKQTGGKNEMDVGVNAGNGLFFSLSLC